MQTALSDLIVGKHIICSCEGTAEKTVIELLMDSDKLCFNRKNLIDNECTTLRKAKDIANEYLTREYELEIVILRIIDREKDNFKIPSTYLLNRKVAFFDVVTKPEIEILHIIHYGLTKEFERFCKRQKQKFNASSFCKSELPLEHSLAKNIKSENSIRRIYENNIDGLVDTIKKYHRIMQHNTYCLYDLIKKAA